MAENFERHVNKGEKAIRILAPAPYKIKEERDKIDPVTQELLLDKDGNPQKEEAKITIPAFRAVSVFDVAQENMSESQTLKTMIHEVAHSKLHSKEVEQDEQMKKDRNTKEMEAESVAYTVCQHFGIDTSDYSFGYIAGWSSGRAK